MSTSQLASSLSSALVTHRNRAAAAAAAATAAARTTARTTAPAPPPVAVTVTPAPAPGPVTIGSTIVFMVHHEQPSMSSLLDAELEHDHRIVYSPRHASAELARVHDKCGAWPRQIFVEGTVCGFWTVSADGSTSRSQNLTATELAEWTSAGYDDAGYVVYIGVRNSDFVRPGSAFQHLKPATVSDGEMELSAAKLLGGSINPSTEGITLSVPRRWVSPRRSVPSNPLRGELAAAGQQQIFGWLAPGEPLGWSAVETGGTYAASYPGRVFAYAPPTGAESLLGRFVVFRGTVCVVERVPNTRSVVLVMAGRADEPLSRR